MRKAITIMILVLIGSIFILGCTQPKVSSEQSAANAEDNVDAASQVVAEDLPASPEEQEIDDSLNELNELDTLDQDLKELDDLSVLDGLN